MTQWRVAVTHISMQSPFIICFHPFLLIFLVLSCSLLSRHATLHSALQNQCNNSAVYMYYVLCEYLVIFLIKHSRYTIHLIDDII